MKLISHRGCTNGIKPDLENRPEFIQEAINLGFDVEIDVRQIEDKLYLGHDRADYEIGLDWLIERKDNLWIHTKNFMALQFLIDKDVRTFYHQKENHTIINNCNLIWSHDLSEANEKSIIPLLNFVDALKYDQFGKVYGICSDFVDIIKIQIDRSISNNIRD